MQGAAATIKRVTLELGGKSANVIFADADLERAAAAAPYAVFDNAGQDCCARSRILVAEVGLRPISGLSRRGHARREASAIPRTMRPRWGRSSRPRTARRWRRSSTASRSSAARTPDGTGFWYPCTLVEASNDDRIAREEVFGPVAAVIPFADEEEAVRLANDTPYGLSGSIWTRDGARALRVARALETGVLSVNSNSSVRVSTPFGGFKQSGFGRELGMQGMEGYSEVKNVFLSTEV